MTTALNWQSRNSARKYPLHDLATGVSKTGVVLPDDFLTDLKCTWPAIYGKRAFLSFAAASAGIVSLGISVMSDNGLVPTPIGHITVTAGTAAQLVHKLTPLVAGATGFATFGDVAELFNCSFDTLAASQLSPNAGRPFGDAGLRSLSIQGATPLFGDIALLGGTDVTVRATTIYLPSNPSVGVPAIAIGLNAPLGDSDPSAEYVGDCNLRPENGNCTQDGLPPAIQTVNGEGFGCNTNLQIVVADATMSRGNGADFATNALAIAYPLTVQDVCKSRERPGAIADVLAECARQLGDPGTTDDMLCTADALVSNSFPDGANGWSLTDWLFLHANAAFGTDLRLDAPSDGLYAYCGYEINTQMLLETRYHIDIGNPNPSDLELLNKRTGLRVNGLLNIDMYNSLSNNITQFEDPEWRIGTELVRVETGFNNVSNASTEIVLNLVITRQNEVVMRKPMGHASRFIASTLFVSLTAAIRDTVNGVVFDVSCIVLNPQVPFTPVNMTYIAKDYGPAYGKHGIFTDMPSYAAFDSFRISRII
jgi:hypothetical protein